MDWHSPRDWMRFIARNGKRMAIFVVGCAVIAAGVAMLVLPGPGLLVIVAGLAILATEFAWAERMLDRAKEQAEKAKEKATSTWRSRRKDKREDKKAAKTADRNPPADDEAPVDDEP